MKPINKWSHTERDPHIHYYFFPIYVKDGGSQLYAQLFKTFSDKIVIQIRDAVAISAEFFESDKKEVEELLDKYYEQNKKTFEQFIISNIFGYLK